MAKSKSSNSNNLLIIGSGGHAVSVASVAIAAGFSILGFIDKIGRKTPLKGIDLLKDIPELTSSINFSIAIAIGDNKIRENVLLSLENKDSIYHYPVICHPSATISAFTNIGAGTVLMPNVVIGPNCKIGNFCILNTNSSIDHDGFMGDFSSIAPGAIAGGNVSLGNRSSICIGAIVKHGVSIGDNSILGANSYLSTNLPSHVVAYGTPARIKRSRLSGDPYL